MLADAITDAAVASAKRNGDPEVTKAHVLSALLTCKGVHWPPDGLPSVDLKAVLGEPGTAINVPGVNAEMLALIERCDTPETAQAVAAELIEQLNTSTSADTTNLPPVAKTLRDVELTEARGAAPVVDSADSSVVRPEETLQQIVACLNRAHPSPVVLHGRPGSGKTTVLRLLAEQLTASEPGRTVRYISARDAALALSKGSVARAVILLDDADLLMGFGATAYGALGVAVSALLAPGGPTVVLSIPTSLRGRFEMAIGRLANRCTTIEIPPLTGASLDEAIGRTSHGLAKHHGVSYTFAALRAAAAPAGAGETSAQPGLGIARLDVAGATVALRPSSVVDHDDVVLGQSGASPRNGLQGLRDRLVSAVIGQEHAVDQLVHRLRLTQAGFDLRPERPDGVFLFVGPTGVGKTALARALALELFGSDTSLIRLDMSEYSEPWAISRLTGPQPGYAGSTEPESWLTTKVRNNPHSVVLLDEIEKAHPDVWNVFLQVFDAGRLTDSKGETADFSSTVVIMTSNLGTGITERVSMGFNANRNEAAQQDHRIMEVVRQSMRPELLNRIDSSVVFRPLDKQTIIDIARSEVGRLASTLGPRGYLIEVGEDAVQYIAADGYDENFGARHVQRAIECRLLEPLVAIPFN
jgi:MoxR-like ATPase